MFELPSLAFLRPEELLHARAEDIDAELGSSHGGGALAEQSLSEILARDDARQLDANDEAAPVGEPAAEPHGEAAVGNEAAGSGAAVGAEPKRDWRTGARAYNSSHRALVERFNAATQDSCGSGGEVDPDRVAGWQREHHVEPDGRVGPRTAAAAQRAARKQVATITSAATGSAGAGEGAAEAAPKQPAAPEATTDHTPQLRAAYAALLKQVSLQQLGEAEAVGKLLAIDRKLNGGASSMAGLLMVPFLLADMAKLAMARLLRGSGGGGTSDAEGGASSGDSTGEAPAPKPEAGPKAAPAVGEPFSRVYTAGSGNRQQQCQVYVSPGGITATPDVFIYFHGFRAQYNIDPKQKGKGEISGLDVAAEAMTHARGKNVIAILPQGKLGESGGGDRTQEGGYMAALQGGLPAFVSSILTPLAADLNMPGLTPRHLSLAGHSAGGYMGMHDALSKAGDLADEITDVTFMDAGYGGGHFQDAAKWAVSGKPGKSVRIIGTNHQLEGTHRHRGTFGRDALTKLAADHSLTVQDGGDVGERRDAETTVVEHTRLMKGNEVQCDVLILQFNKTGNAGRDHSPLRDRVLDDAMLSIGEGAAGNETFGERDRGGEPTEYDAEEAPTVKPAVEKGKGAAGSKTTDTHVKEAVKKVDKPKEPETKGKKKKESKYDGHVSGVDSFGNLANRDTSKRGHKSNATTFATPFTVVHDGKLYGENHKSLKKSLPHGTQVYVADMDRTWVQVTCKDAAHPITAEDDVWMKFASLGGHGADVGLGNERSDGEDKARADKLREGLPEGRNPGQSKYKWRFSGDFMPALDGVSLAGSLMGKVQALMEWAIYNDMVLGDIVIGSGMRSPKAAHYLCVRYEQANMDKNKNVTLAALQALPGGRDADGNKWYEPGWTETQAIEYAQKKIKDAGASGKVAAAGYNPGDPRRAPLPLNGKPGVSNHCSGHAVDVDIKWRSAEDPNKVDLWGWEQLYHQFGLTRPLHRDRGGKASTQESWHIEETGKDLEVEEAESPPQ